MKQFTKLNTETEHAMTMAEWHRHRDAEYQRVQNKKIEQKKVDNSE